MSENPYVRSQNQCDFHDVDCECLVGQRCQLVQPPTLASALEECEQTARALVGKLELAMTMTPSGTALAHSMTTVRLAKELVHQVGRLRSEVGK